MSFTEEIDPEVSAFIDSREFSGLKARGRPRVTVCNNGHDKTVEGALNNRGQCIACSRARSHAHYLAKKANK